LTSRPGHSRQRYVGASTKAFLGYRETLNWLTAIRQVVDGRTADGLQSFVIPSFPVLESAIRIFEGTDVWVGAQTSAWGDGALTGEVSPRMLAELGVRIVEVGHAERRELFGETDEAVARKTSAIRAAGLIPLVCVGEPALADAATAAGFAFKQLNSALGDSLDGTVIAYEPVWAIGADQPAEPDYINDVIGRLRMLSGDDNLSIIYGGSAGPGLLPQLTEADGLFLGRFARDPANLRLVLDEALALEMDGQLDG
jgi:triosephosphate isomerase